MKVDEKNPPAVFGSPIYGSVEFWIRPLCIGIFSIRLTVITEETIGNKYNLPSESTANIFHAIFPSYAREDSEFVEHLEKAYSLINLQHDWDVSILHSGLRTGNLELRNSLTTQIYFNFAGQRLQLYQSMYKMNTHMLCN